MASLLLCCMIFAAGSLLFKGLPDFIAQIQLVLEEERSMWPEDQVEQFEPVRHVLP